MALGIFLQELGILAESGKGYKPGFWAEPGTSGFSWPIFSYFSKDCDSGLEIVETWDFFAKPGTLAFFWPNLCSRYSAEHLGKEFHVRVNLTEMCLRQGFHVRVN